MQGNRINNNVGSNGRLGNHFFRNIIASVLSKKNNLKFTYSYLPEFTKLGVQFYNGSNRYDNKNTITVLNRNVMKLINEDVNTNMNYNLHDDYFQLPETAIIIREWCNLQQDGIINANPHKMRYKNNNDVFVHIRLDDARDFSQPFSYYDSVLSELVFDKAYISSDSINDDICKKLIEKYKMEIISKDSIETIQFAATCKSIILSTGTYSWMIGILSFFSTIYYPKIKKNWHGNIFVFSDWNEINW
jgi:hypothetical protein